MNYWQTLGVQFLKRPIGKIALGVVILFCLVGVYAPLLASSRPLYVQYEGTSFFPLFRYLFYSGFYTKHLDLFFNLLMFTMPITLLWRSRLGLITVGSIQCLLFLLLILFPLKDPASSPELVQARQQALPGHLLPSWEFDLKFMNPYAKLNLVLQHHQEIAQQKRLEHYQATYGAAALQRWLEDALRKEKRILKRQAKPIPSDTVLEKEILARTDKETLAAISALPTLLRARQEHLREKIARQKRILATTEPGSPSYTRAEATLQTINDKEQWQNTQQLHHLIMPLIRPYHWQDDAGGEQSLNQFVDWWELTRINRKDLVASLIFGVRISLVVGLMAVGLSMLIGIPIGALAGYYGGKWDMIVCRLLEIWESMPTLFMLLLVIAVTQSKSIFLVISVIGLFGWTSFSRYIRGEFFKQKNLTYVEACRSLGFNDRYIIFSHILPNAIPPLLTLLPFAVMAAITSEAGLSFLGLGEEGSCSWGVLMDEGRSAFPGESYLLWPPALLLTLLLVAIALVGDTLRDVLDPKMHR